MLVVTMAVVGLQVGLALGGARCHADAETRTFGLSTLHSSQWVPRGESCGLPTRRALAVRSVEKSLNRLIDDGRRRSPTFARLAETIDEHRAIVYVEPRDVLKAGLTGAVPSVIIQAPGGMRYVRVWILRGRPPDDLIETIGHELQHVIELLETEADDTVSDHLSDTTRSRDPATGLWMIETDAARHAGEAVHLELLTTHRPDRRSAKSCER